MKRTYLFFLLPLIFIVAACSVQPKSVTFTLINYDNDCYMAEAYKAEGKLISYCDPNYKGLIYDIKIIYDPYSKPDAFILEPGFYILGIDTWHHYETGKIFGSWYLTAEIHPGADTNFAHPLRPGLPEKALRDLKKKQTDKNALRDDLEKASREAAAEADIQMKALIN